MKKSYFNNFFVGFFVAALIFGYFFIMHIQSDKERIEQQRLEYIKRDEIGESFIREWLGDNFIQWEHLTEEYFDIYGDREEFAFDYLHLYNDKAKSFVESWFDYANDEDIAPLVENYILSDRPHSQSIVWAYEEEYGYNY